MIDGVLLINKPVGISSFDVIRRLTKLFPPKTHIGHGGTLDPFASGLLVIMVGRARHLARYFLGSDKHYEASLLFGEERDTGDPEGAVIHRSDFRPSHEQLTSHLASLEGTVIMQVPPMFSAKKHQGMPLYSYARRGIILERQATACSLHRCRLLSWEQDCTRFEVICSSGTYIRVLGQDIARACGSVGHLVKLNRLASGNFRNAIDLETPDLLSYMIPFDRLLDGVMPEIQIEQSEMHALRQGKQHVLSRLQPQARVFLSYNKTLVATAIFDTQWRLERVFVCS